MPAFKLGGRIFVNADVSTQLIPQEGPNALQPFTVQGTSKLEVKHNGKAVTLKGNRIVPIAIAMGEAEPSFSIGLDTNLITVDYLEHCGDGAARMQHDIIVTMTRPGLLPVTFKVLLAIIENGFGFSVDAGQAVKDEFSGKNVQTLMNYKGRDWDPFGLPEGGVAL